MLRTRVITALVLFLALFVVLFYGGSAGWAVFLTAVLFFGLWEWARLGQLSPRYCVLYALVGTLVCTGVFQWMSVYSFAFPVMGLASIFWIVFAPLCLRKLSIRPFNQPVAFLLLGVLLLAAGCVALLLAKTVGLVFLLSILSICWVADIFAYFFGKALGQHKLAPSISPGKSWEGAIGGTCSVLLLSWLVVGLASEFSVLRSTWQYMAYQDWHPAVFSCGLVLIGAFSVVGDLFESMLKRSVGMKDSSQLLPGHGGVLDRIDAQLPVLPLALLLFGQHLFL